MPIESGYLLVVDADPATGLMLNSQLEQRGYTVAVASRGRQALTMLQAQAYDLVLLALDLPEMDGIRVLRSITSDATLKALPVILLAAESDMRRIEEGLALGAEDYVATPINLTILRMRIRTCLEKKRLRSQEQGRYEQAALIKIERDLDSGQKMQAGFLPKELPALPGWELATYYNPAREVGGDLYDVFVMTQGGLIGLILGDVCDKGIGAALFMALFRSFFRAAAQQRYPLGWITAHEPDVSIPIDAAARQKTLLAIGTIVLQSAFELANNYVVHNHAETGYFITLFFGVLDPLTGILLYANGGHLPIFIIDRDGVKARLTTTGPAVGIFPDVIFGIEQVQLAPGDFLFCYSDGVTDARDPDHHFFSAKRLIELIEQPVSSAVALIERIDEQVSAHIASAEQYDDITMLVARRLPEATGQGDDVTIMSMRQPATPEGTLGSGA